MGPSILYPHPPKNREKMGSELTGKILQNEFFNRVWQETTIITEFAVKNCLRIINQISKSSSESLIRAKFHFLLDYSRIFAAHFSLRYSQDLYPDHTSPSRVSTLPYSPSIPPTSSSNFALQNFLEIVFWYSQSLYKTHTSETLVSSFPLVFLDIQHRPPRLR